MPTFHIHDPAELAVSLPWQLGVALDHDIVAVILRGGTVQLVIRFDVCPPGTDLVIPPSAAATGDEALVISYGLDVPLDGPVPAEVSVVARALDEAGIRVQDIWCANERELRFPLDPCSRAMPLPAPANVPLIAEWVGRGRSPELSRREWQARIAERSPQRATVRRRTRPAFATATEVWRELLDPGPQARRVADIMAEPRVSHAMSALLEDEFRAVLHAAVCPRLREFAQLSRAGADQLDALVGRVHSDQQCRSGPFEETLASRESIVRGRLIDVVALTPEFARPAVLVALALGAWGMGDGLLAGVAAEQALRENPGDTEAILVRQVLAAGARGVMEDQDIAGSRAR